MSASDYVRVGSPDGLAQLVGLVRMHHEDHRLSLEVADGLFGDVFDKYLFAHPRLEEVQSAYLALEGALSRHILREESVLLPYLDQLATAERVGTAIFPPPFGNVRQPLRELEIEREVCLRLVRNLRGASGNFAVPSGVSPAFEQLYQVLARLTRDVEANFLLEASLLAPHAIATEDRLLGNDPERTGLRPTAH